MDQTDITALSVSHYKRQQSKKPYPDAVISLFAILSGLVTSTETPSRTAVSFIVKVLFLSQFQWMEKYLFQGAMPWWQPSTTLVRLTMATTGLMSKAVMLGSNVMTPSFLRSVRLR